MSDTQHANTTWSLQDHHPNTTCAKCGYTRQSTDTAPEWQCPQCELAYVKTNAAAQASRNRLTELRQQPALRESDDSAASDKAPVSRTQQLVVAGVLTAVSLVGGTWYMKVQHAHERTALAQAAQRQQQIDAAKQQQQQDESLQQTISQAMNQNDPGSRDKLQNYAEHGNTTAMVALGRMALYGRGSVPTDQAQALKWFEKASAEGDPNAMVNLGFMYEMGLSVPKQIELAANWYLNAARQGHASALYSLAWLYEKGTGIAPDTAKAYLLYELAARAYNVNPNGNYGLIPNNRSGLGSVAQQLSLKPKMSPVDVVHAVELADAWKVGMPL
jgi:uncharacterized protein